MTLPPSAPRFDGAIILVMVIVMYSVCLGWLFEGIGASMIVDGVAVELMEHWN